MNKHPAVVAAEERCKVIAAAAEAADNDPNYEFDPEAYIMPSSMMRGTQVDADQLPPLPNQD